MKNKDDLFLYVIARERSAAGEPMLFITAYLRVLDGLTLDAAPVALRQVTMNMRIWASYRLGSAPSVDLGCTVYDELVDSGAAHVIERTMRPIERGMLALRDTLGPIPESDYGAHFLRLAAVLKADGIVVATEGSEDKPEDERYHFWYRRDEGRMALAGDAVNKRVDEFMKRYPHFRPT